MTHILTIDRRSVKMTVWESETEFLCELFMQDGGEKPKWSDEQYEHVYAWFNAIISDLRANSDKCIHLFDRQHVMTT